MNKLVSVALLRVSASVFTKIRERKHTFPSRKPYGNIEKVVRLRRNRSHGNMNKRHESATGNTCYPLCFRNVVTCFHKISVCGILAFRPVYVLSLPPFSKNISYNSSSNTEAIKGSEITLAKRECLCEAKLQGQLNTTTTTIASESSSL